MVNVVYDKCAVCGLKQPSFAVPGERATHCGGCKDGGDGERESPGSAYVCGLKRASFAMPGQRETHCGGCKVGGMVDVRSRKCVACGLKHPSYGPRGVRPTHCAGCAEPGMVLSDTAGARGRAACVHQHARRASTAFVGDASVMSSPMIPEPNRPPRGVRLRSWRFGMPSTKPSRAGVMTTRGGGPVTVTAP